MKISNEFKVGALAVVCVAALIIGYNALKGNAVFSSSNTYYAIYPSVEGLNVSNPVKIKGVQVGRVTNIVLGEKVTVEFTVDEVVKIPKKSLALINGSDLLGSRFIEIELRKDSTAGTPMEYYQDGETLNSEMQQSLSENVQAQILPVKQKAEKLLSSIDSVVTIIRGVFNRETQENIVRSVRNISNTLDHVNNSAANVDELLEKNTTKLQSIFNNIEAITATLKKNEQNITAILSNLNSITDSLAKSNIKQTIAHAEDALRDVSGILEKINKGEGSVGLLINDDKLYNNLEQSAKDLDLLMQDLKANPGRYVHLSIFGPKKEKSAPQDATPK